jgi:recombination protein RecA
VLVAKGKGQEAQLAAVLKAIQTGMKRKGVVGRLSDEGVSEVREVLPTGVPAIDKYVLGIGGLPVGRIVELYSEEGGGKTSLLYAVLAQAIAEGGIALLADTEQSLSAERAAVFGVDPERVGVLGFDETLTMEEFGRAAEEALTAIPHGIGPNVLGWDSIAATPMQMEIDGNLDELKENAVAMARAKFLGRLCKKLGKLAAEKRTLLLFVNQLREKPGVMFGDNKYTPGGKAVKFHASVRLQLFGGKAVKIAGGFHTGKDILVMSSKNKMCPPWRKARVRLDYEEGWNPEWTTCELAKTFGLVGPKATLAEATAALDGIGWRPTGTMQAVQKESIAAEDSEAAEPEEAA